MTGKVTEINKHTSAVLLMVAGSAENINRSRSMCWYWRINIDYGRWKHVFITRRLYCPFGTVIRFTPTYTSRRLFFPNRIDCWAPGCRSKADFKHRRRFVEIKKMRCRCYRWLLNKTLINTYVVEFSTRFRWKKHRKPHTKL